YLATLREINDRIFLMTGVDRSVMKSLWMPRARWTEITEQGFDGGPVMPESFDGSRDSLDDLRQNIYRAGIVGSLVSNDQRSSMIFIPLLERDSSGKGLDYKALRDELEDIKQQY